MRKTAGVASRFTVRRQVEGAAVVEPVGGSRSAA